MFTVAGIRKERCTDVYCCGYEERKMYRCLLLRVLGRKDVQMFIVAGMRKKRCADVYS
jgi:hypothetical protein